jgi:hypothetical protein
VPKAPGELYQSLPHYVTAANDGSGLHRYISGA